jgi:tetratricopeptide (TPR) repeat protein
MMRIRQIFMITVFLGILANPLTAQKGIEDGSKYGHGEDSIECIKNLSLYREFIKNQGYHDAIGPWREVFNDCPLATKNIYIDGVKMYNHYIDREKDPVIKAAFMDTLRLIYDQRIQYFKQEGSVLARKGVDILRHPEYRQDPDILEEAYGYLNRSLNILKNKSLVAVIATYMTSSIMLYQAGRIDDTRVIEDYAMTTDILDHQLKNTPDNASLLKVKNANDANFIASGAPTCESLLRYFEPQFEERKDDLPYLRRVVGFLGALECESEPFYARAAETLYAKEPSAEAAYGLAKLFLSKEQYTKSIGYYEEAIDLEQDPQNKADYYYQLAFIIQAKMNQRERARSYALEALKLRPDWGDPYILIGDAYAGSKDCFEDEFEKATIYWVAVDKFQKAKAVDPESAEKADERIITYSKYFPDVETVFFYSLEEGDPYTVGCWINETTTVRPR